MTDQEPWWHATPDDPPVDSVLEEGMKLFAVLKDWAVESGAVSAVADLTATAANSAGAYISQLQDSDVEEVDVAEPVEQVVRCADCPVCRGLDALEHSNPQLADTARAALAQVNALIAGFLPGETR